MRDGIAKVYDMKNSIIFVLRSLDTCCLIIILGPCGTFAGSQHACNTVLAKIALKSTRLGTALDLRIFSEFQGRAGPATCRVSGLLPAKSFCEHATVTFPAHHSHGPGTGVQSAQLMLCSQLIYLTRQLNRTGLPALCGPHRLPDNALMSTQDMLMPQTSGAWVPHPQRGA